jgi:DNA polymerase-3 subunit beta
MQYEIDLRAIKAASFAMSSEETRYYLKGVNIEISAAHGILAIATDGHRLIAMQAAPTPQAITGDREIIIPAETVKRIKINRRYSDGILRDMGNGQWQIEHDGQIWAFQPIDGSFPAWRRVLPKHSTPAQYLFAIVSPVEWNAIICAQKPLSFKIESRRGYKLITFKGGLKP